MKTPDYNHLQEKTRQAGYDWSLKRAIVEIDRDSERRWQFAADRAQLAREKGEILADSAPLEENYLIPNKGGSALVGVRNGATEARTTR